MTTRTVSVGEFLLARIEDAEDLAIRQHDISMCVAIWHRRLDQLDREWADCNCGVPDRVLAECEAIRRIVQSFPVGPESIGEWDEAAWTVLTTLAQPYADHADFRDEWRA